MNKTFKKIFSVCCAVVTTLTATLFHSTKLQAYGTTPRIVFAGPSQAGKTKLISKICGNSYDSDYVPTITMEFDYTRKLNIWATGGDNALRSILDANLKSASLCVLSISNTNQETADFLKLIAENNVPNVVLCITKTDESVPDSDAVSELLDKIKQTLQDVNVFDEVLYTSAKDNKFKFCTPDKYTASDEYRIYNTETNETVLADKLYELCTGKKYALGLGIPAALLTLIFGTAYYEYDRHFRKKIRNKTKTKSEQTPKVNRKISS